MNLFEKIAGSISSGSLKDFKDRANRPARRARTRSLLVEKMEQRRLLAVINVATLPINRGTLVAGLTAGEQVGRSVSSAGDINFDRFEDMLISTGGKTHLAMGGEGDDNGNLSWDLARTAVFESSDPDLACGRVASGVGDVNGDRLDDILFGCATADPPGGEQNAGASFLVLSTPSTPFQGRIDISQLQHPRELLGYRGVKIYGADAGDGSGRSVKGAGDFNGDGFADILIGASYADAANNAKADAGETYIIFGSANPPPTINLANLGNAGVVLFGASAGVRSGAQVSGAGDLNGDGYDDVIVKSDNEVHVVFGRASLPRTIDLAQLGASGIRIHGSNHSLSSISQAGDVNGDGFDDIIIGNPAATRRLPGDRGDMVSAGESYLIYGKAALPRTINLTNLGDQGIKFVGAESRDGSGSSVSGGRDFNADGFDDIIIGAPNANSISNPSYQFAGVSYILFGGPSLPAVTDLALQINGIKVSGADGSDFLGASVSFAGDINSDGFADVVIGIPLSDSTGNGKNNAGEVAVVYGRNVYTNSVTHLSGKRSETLIGTAGTDVMVGVNDYVVGNGGADVIYAGAVAISSTDFKKIANYDFFGRLIFTGSGMTLDLTTLADNRLLGFNEINLRGTGNNRLILDKQEVLNLHDRDNSLLVRRNLGDTVELGPGWAQLPNEWIESVTYEVFQQGAAKVRIESVNLAPVISGFETPITFIENGQPILIDTDVSVIDTDSPNYAGGRLFLYFQFNADQTDRFTIRNIGNGPNQIGVSGNVVKFGGVAIGTFTGTNSLWIPFNSNATTLAIQTLLRNITYVNTSDAPPTYTRVIRLSLSDGGGGQNSGFSNLVSKTVNIIAANDAPSITGIRSNVTYLKTGSPIRIAATGIVTDIDSQNFSGGRLTIRATSNAQLTDRIAIHNQGVGQGQIGFSGVNVTFSGVLIGTRAGGIGTVPLTITFNNNATRGAVQALLRQIVWSSTSPTPVTLPRRLIFLLTDGDGGESEVAATRVLVR